MTKENAQQYIREQYRLAVLDFKTAKNEDEQFAARRTMAGLERIAAESFGFDFADELFSMTREPGQQPAVYELPEEVFRLREDM